MSRFNQHEEEKIDFHFCFFGRDTQTNTKNRYSYQQLITTMAAFSNAQITKLGAQRFQFDESCVTPRSKEREQRRLARQVVVLFKPERPYPGCPLTTAQAEQWAAELDAASIDRFSEDYNRWHTLDDHLDYGALIRGIHNIQERGGSGADEQRFMNAVTDRWGHPRLTTQR